MRKTILYITIVLGVLFCGKAPAQSVGIKTNTLYWLTTSLNAGVEVELGNRTTLDLSAAYNPWNFKENKKMHFWLAQPAVKYWFCEKFEGHFVNVHFHGAQFYGGFKDKIYDGYLAGGGIGYGYDWILSSHWNLETEIGIGYARLWYKESPNIPCLKCRKNRHENYWGPTKVALSFTYIF